MLDVSFLAGKKICISGATGFLGRHLLSLLAGTDAELTCIVRKSSVTSGLPANARIAICDFASAEGLAAALEGQDIFIHMASLLFALSWQDYLRANATACQNIASVLAANGRNNTCRLVYVSSLSAAGPCASAIGLDEKTRPAPVSAYGWSKLICENILSAAVSNLVILRPPIIYGSGDRGLLPMFKSASRGLGASPGAFRRFPVSIIHAADAAQAVILACQDRAGGIYHLNDGSVHDMDEICNAMSLALGRKKAVVLHTPLPLMAISAAFCSAFGICAAKLSTLAGRRPGRAPNWNLDKYREARQCGWTANAARMENELGFRAEISLSEGMKEAVDGYRAEGWL